MRSLMLVALLPLVAAVGRDPFPTAAATAGPGGAPAPQPPAPPAPPAAPPAPAAPFTAGDGRKPVAAADMLKSPYRYVGRLADARHPTSWGTATLIGPRHVLTAAHVVEDLAGVAAAGGVVTFTLPDGRSSEVTDAELDGGWRKKIVSCDFALVALKDELGAGGAHAAWATFDDATHLGARLHISGYDSDLWAAGGRPAVPVLYDRTTTVARLDKYKAEYVASLDVMIVGAAAGAAARKMKQTGPFLGAAALSLGYLGLKGHALDKLGWAADDARQGLGASGGPLWADDPAGPRVVGVTGHAAKKGVRAGVPYGRPVGSKLTPGPCADMVRNFIRTHP